MDSSYSSSQNKKDSCSINQVSYLKSFECLADKCEDTCCTGWSMQVDAERIKLYQEKAAELLPAVDTAGKTSIMKRDEKSGDCVKFSGGLCSIQQKYGSEFLGDACNFYPRITRKVGGEIYMAAALSCPEIARLALYKNPDFTYSSAEVTRLPNSLKDYLENSGAEKTLSKEQAHALYEKFLFIASDENATPERIISRIAELSRSLNYVPKHDWLNAATALSPGLDGRLPPSVTAHADPFNLLNILSGLIAGTNKNTINPKLYQVVTSIEDALGVKVNWQKKTVERVKEKKYSELRLNYYSNLSALTAAPLRNWIKAQLVAGFFPFGGFGNNIIERIIIIAVRFATLKLAIMANMPQFTNEPEKTMVFLVQTLARFMDHLADPELSIACYQEAGWDKPECLRGLIDDC